MHHFMTDQELRVYQTKHIWQPGELVEIWDYDTNKSQYSVVISDISYSKLVEASKGGRQQQIEIRKISVMSHKGIILVDKWSIYPVIL